MNPVTLSRYVVGYASAAALGVGAGWCLSLVLGGAPAPLDTETSTSVRLIGGNPTTLLTLRGKGAHLVPGRPTELKVHVSNVSPWSIRVLSISVTADDASPGCRVGRNLSVSSYLAARPHAHTYVVPSKHSTVVPLRILLVNAPRRNQDACKGVVFPLSYSGTAVRQRLR